MQTDGAAQVKPKQAKRPRTLATVTDRDDYPEQFCFRLSTPMFTAVLALAKQDDRSVGYVLRQLLEKGLSK